MLLLFPDVVFAVFAPADFTAGAGGGTFTAPNFSQLIRFFIGSAFYIWAGWFLFGLYRSWANNKMKLQSLAIYVVRAGLIVTLITVILQ